MFSLLVVSYLSSNMEFSGRNLLVAVKKGDAQAVQEILASQASGKFVHLTSSFIIPIQNLVESCS